MNCVNPAAAAACHVPVAIQPPATTQACTVPVQACIQASTVNPELKYQLTDSLHRLINRCQQVGYKLSEALHHESMDACTSNTSVFGWLISSQSYYKNHEVANEVDCLVSEARRVNALMAQFPGLNFLSVGFNGHDIRRAENQEHSFFPNFISGWQYSDFASQHTWRVLADTKQRVEMLQHQCYNTLNVLNIR